MVIETAEQGQLLLNLPGPMANALTEGTSLPSDQPGPGRLVLTDDETVTYRAHIAHLTPPAADLVPASDAGARRPVACLGADVYADTGAVADGPDGTGIDLVANAFVQQCFDAVDHGLPVVVVCPASSA